METYDYNKSFNRTVAELLGEPENSHKVGVQSFSVSFNHNVYGNLMPSFDIRIEGFIKKDEKPPFEIGAYGMLIWKTK